MVLTDKSGFYRLVNLLNKTLIYLVLIFFSCNTSKSLNTDKTDESFDIKVSARITEVDNLGRIYLVDEKNKLINYSPDLMEMYRYANNRSGLISDIDVTNPLKIIVFYDDFNQVKIFDNTLTPINEVNLALNFVDISACATSNDGHLWIYDPTQFKLIKVNENGQILVESSNVNDFGMKDLKVTSIKEKSNTVVLMDKSKGFYFFDNLGQYIFHYSSTDIVHFQFDGLHLIYYTSDGLYVYNLATKENQKVNISDKIEGQGVQNILYQQGKYYLVYDQGLKIIKEILK